MDTRGKNDMLTSFREVGSAGGGGFPIPGGGD